MTMLVLCVFLHEWDMREQDTVTDDNNALCSQYTASEPVVQQLPS